MLLFVVMVGGYGAGALSAVWRRSGGFARTLTGAGAMLGAVAGLALAVHVLVTGVPFTLDRPGILTLAGGLALKLDALGAFFLEGRAPADGVELAERVSGDTSVGHALAYCQALESVAGTAIPDRARYLRVVLLEMERLYNHVADFGMIANDTGFAVAHSHCFRIRERLLRLNKRLTGHRLLRGGVIPGGVRSEVPRDLDLLFELEAAVRDFEEIVALSLRNTLVTDRLEGTGRLTTRTAPRPRRAGVRRPRGGHRR